MTRFFGFAAAAAASLVLLPAANAQTAAANGYYAATPVTAPAKASLVTRSTVWKCGDGACTAGKSNARDAVMCQLVVREVGALSAFTAGGQSFDADALAKCNARAR